LKADHHGRTSGNAVLEEALMKVRKAIEEGRTIVDPLRECGVFPNMVTQMIGVGEATGAMDAMLQKIADFYEDEVDAATKDMLTLLEPVMIGFLGVMRRRHRDFAVHAAVRHDRETGERVVAAGLGILDRRALAFILYGSVLELNYYAVIPSYCTTHPGFPGAAGNHLCQPVRVPGGCVPGRPADGKAAAGRRAVQRTPAARWKACRCCMKTSSTRSAAGW
jgi:hypothetical protein